METLAGVTSVTNKTALSVERTAWDYIPPNTLCERSGCDLPALNVHHTLRPSFNDMVVDPNGLTIARRNQRHLIQHLCAKHHHDEGHNLFSETGKWPEGFGTEEVPFRRNCTKVEALIAARLEPTPHAENSWTA